MDYSCIVFDTAPTGHTLRLLEFPATLQKGLAKLMSLRGMLGGLVSQLGSLLGGSAGAMQTQLLGRLEELQVCPNHMLCMLGCTAQVSALSICGPDLLSWAAC